jgi:monomeric phenylalanine-4-hydroxylase
MQELVYQDCGQYLDEDHHTWSLLSAQQNRLSEDVVSAEYLNGFRELQLDNKKIINIADLSARLERLSGWTLVPVRGLIPIKEFFQMLIDKRYPVTIYIRKPTEIEFSEQPDIFHDVCGHVPLLINKKFSDFLTAYSVIALTYVNNDRALDLLGRLYWFTYEMGIINENGKLKAYGGAIITSSREIINIHKAAIPKFSFDLGQILKTKYNPYALQKGYFVVDSFDELFDNLRNLEPVLMDHLRMQKEELVLKNYSLNIYLGKGFNNVIGFLNDIQFRFPNAISFVAGQPDERFFDIEKKLSQFYTYVKYKAEQSKSTWHNTINAIGQYNKTKGIINDIISEYLRNDENIDIKPEHILVTVGAQEAFGIIVTTICNRKNDVILVEDPSYIGVSSFSKIFEYNLDSVPTDENGINLELLEKKLIQLNKLNKTVKLLYIIPDYQNPSGYCMPVNNRLQLLELANQYNFLIIEDTVYNSFSYTQQKKRTLKFLDKYNRVIYVGSFSKSIFPGLRIGLIAADQKIENEFKEVIFLIDEMAKVKAQITNNTPTINQAILGGILLDNDCSLYNLYEPKLVAYKEKRDLMVNALAKYIKDTNSSWSEGISWNEPDGGLFIKIRLPFEVDDTVVIDCAQNFDVIFCPMKNFYLKKGGETEIRLTFSNLTLAQIDSGIERLARFLKYKICEDFAQTAEEAQNNIH